MKFLYRIELQKPKQNQSGSIQDPCLPCCSVAKDERTCTGLHFSFKGHEFSNIQDDGVSLLIYRKKTCKLRVSVTVNIPNLKPLVSKNTNSAKPFLVSTC